MLIAKNMLADAQERCAPWLRGGRETTGLKVLWPKRNDPGDGAE